MTEFNSGGRAASHNQRNGSIIEVAAPETPHKKCNVQSNERLASSDTYQYSQ